MQRKRSLLLKSSYTVFKGDGDLLINDTVWFIDFFLHIAKYLFKLKYQKQSWLNCFRKKDQKLDPCLNLGGRILTIYCGQISYRYSHLQL